jgi:hypothetical protein
MPRGRPRKTDANERHPLYPTWLNMRQRCSNPKDEKYPSYGGRGITVCERWQDFKYFVSDMGPKPGPGYTLERADNDGNYDPFNCVWATYVQQAANRHPRKSPERKSWRERFTQ